MARGTSATLTLLIVATILVHTTASQRRDDAIKRNLDSFNTEQVAKDLSADATLTAAVDKGAGRKLLQGDYGDEEECDYTNDYCGEGSTEEADVIDETDEECDYTNDYCGEGPTEEPATEDPPATDPIDETEECDYTNDYCGEGPTQNDTPDSDTASNEGDAPSGNNGADSDVPIDNFVPSGNAPSGGTGGNAPSNGGTVTPAATTAPSQGISVMPATSTTPATGSVPSQNGTSTAPGSLPLESGTVVATPLNSTEGAANSTEPGAQSASVTTWTTHGVHYTACVTGMTVAIAFFTNSFF